MCLCYFNRKRIYSLKAKISSRWKKPPVARDLLLSMSSTHSAVSITVNFVNMWALIFDSASLTSELSLLDFHLKVGLMDQSSNSSSSATSNALHAHMSAHANIHDSLVSATNPNSNIVTRAANKVPLPLPTVIVSQRSGVGIGGELPSTVSNSISQPNQSIPDNIESIHKSSIPLSVSVSKLAVALSRSSDLTTKEEA